MGKMTIENEDHRLSRKELNSELKIKKDFQFKLDSKYFIQQIKKLGLQSAEDLDDLSVEEIRVVIDRDFEFVNSYIVGNLTVEEALIVIERAPVTVLTKILEMVTPECSDIIQKHIKTGWAYDEV